VIGRLPHEFSGGQCQRICIARALVLNPEFYHLRRAGFGARRFPFALQNPESAGRDEARYGLTLLFIAHDLAVVKA